MTNKIRSTLVVATILATALLLINISSATADNGTGGCEDNSDAKLGYCVEADRDNATARLWKTDENQSQGVSPGDDSSTVDAQRALEAADSAPDPRALAYEEWLVARHHIHRISMARGHGSQHRPEVDSPLLHPAPGVAVHARWPIPA